MGKKWVSTAAGGHLKGRKRAGTDPEVALRSALRHAGVGYRVQHRIAKGCTPDIVLLGARVAVFVDGCFWHGCPQHGRDSFSGPNAELWVEKMRRNRERDTRATTLASAAGFAVVRLWECELLSATCVHAARLRELRDRRQLRR